MSDGKILIGEFIITIYYRIQTKWAIIGKSNKELQRLATKPQKVYILFTKWVTLHRITLVIKLEARAPNLPGAVSSPTCLCASKYTVCYRNYKEISGVSCQRKRVCYSGFFLWWSFLSSYFAWFTLSGATAMAQRAPSCASTFSSMTPAAISKSSRWPVWMKHRKKRNTEFSKPERTWE